MGSDYKPVRKVYAATGGAAFGEILSVALSEGAGFEWWPAAATVILFTFLFGYLIPEKRPG